jgi:hypothetical protein
MGSKRILIALLVAALSAVLSVGAWLALREPISRAVRLVTATAIQLSGGRVAYPPEPVTRAAGEVAGDKIGIVMTTMSDGGQRRTRSYGVSLMRWHVNVIVLPVLVMSLGSVSLGQRMAMLAIGIPLLLTLDGCSAFFYLLLGARRTLGDEIVSSTLHANLEHALAVYVTKLLPIIVWGTLYLLMMAWPVRTGAVSPDSG